MDEELRRFYLENLTPRIEALEEAAAALPAAPSAEAARRLAHSLKGSGGTYGFPAITVAAARAEEAADAELPEALTALVGVLREAVEQGPAPEPGPPAPEGSASAPRVLLVEDDPDILALLERRLGAAGLELTCAPTLAEARRRLEQERPAAVVLDLVLPDGDGRSFLGRLRERPETAALPVVVLSAHAGRVTQTECFALGADDYFEKPFDAELLAASVAARVRRGADLARHAQRDELTGLPNRAALRQAHRALAGAAGAIALIDLDRFKEVNDRHGHAAGDQALREAARTLRSALPASAELARWGGEEFAALFRGTRPSAARAQLEAALRALRETVVRTPGGAELTLGFSAGVADAAEGSLEEALARADHLLYLAKAGGRGRVLAPGDEPEGARETVLLCEDDAVTASLIKHRLGRERFQVRHFTDGLDAWEWAQRADSVDLAILDVKMPGMDGFELLGRLRGLPTFREVPLLMLTSMGSERDVVRGFELGADDYVVKPFSPAELVARLHRHLRRT